MNKIVNNLKASNEQICVEGDIFLINDEPTMMVQIGSFKYYFISLGIGNRWIDRPFVRAKDNKSTMENISSFLYQYAMSVKSIVYLGAVQIELKNKSK